MLKRYENIVTAMRRHSVEPTVFVLSKSEGGALNIMAAGWNMKCSYEPPMMAVALSKKGYTHQLIQQTKEFVLAVPNPGHEQLLQYVGTTTGAQIDKFAEKAIPTQPAAEISVLLMSEARADFECKLHSVVETGDHLVFMGVIVAAHYNVDQDQLYFAGKNEADQKVFKTITTHFPEDVQK